MEEIPTWSERCADRATLEHLAGEVIPAIRR